MLSVFILSVVAPTTLSNFAVKLALEILDKVKRASLLSEISLWVKKRLIRMALGETKNRSFYLNNKKKYRKKRFS
jgi:hypothetical protein